MTDSTTLSRVNSWIANSAKVQQHGFDRALCDFARKLGKEIDALVTETRDHIGAIDEENFHLIQQRDAAHESARNAEANYTAQQAITQLFKVERDAAADLMKEKCIAVCRTHRYAATILDGRKMVAYTGDLESIIRSTITDPAAVKRTLEDAELLRRWVALRRAQYCESELEARTSFMKITDATRKGEEGKL